MDKTEQEKEYTRLMGAEALERQKKLAKETCPECYGKLGRHSPRCRRGHIQKLRQGDRS